jgi:hypothetical protein
MVSFRYHVVTIVAVFVALAVGLLMGTAFLDQGLVSDLKNRTTSLSSKVSQLQGEVKDTQGLLATSELYAEKTRTLAVDGRLNGDRVVIVTEEGVDLSDLNGVRQTLSGSGGAGATIDGVLVLSKDLSMEDPATRQQVATILGRSPNESPERLQDALARALAQRLALGAPTEAGATDLLVELVDAGLVTLSDAQEGPSAVGGAGAAVSILSGTSSTPVIPPDTFYVPLIQELVTIGTNTAALQPSTTGSPFISTVRSDGQTHGKIVTVDNIEMVPGQVALVWGLDDLIAGKGGGDYGVDCGSCSLVPAPTSSP